MDTCDKVTLRDFARRTGWPYAELMQTGVFEFAEVLALMGLTLSFRRRKK